MSDRFDEQANKIIADWARKDVPDLDWSLLRIDIATALRESQRIEWPGLTEDDVKVIEEYPTDSLDGECWHCGQYDPPNSAFGICMPSNDPAKHGERCEWRKLREVGAKLRSRLSRTGEETK